MRFSFDDSNYHKFFDDFDRYVVADYTLTTTEAGAGSASEALGNEDGGVLVITNDAADNDCDFFQKVGESFKFEVGKRLYFEARLKINDATQSDLVMGLQITDTSPLAVSDGIFFRKDDGDAHLDFVVCKNGTETLVPAVVDMVDATYLTMGFYYDGSADHIAVFVNDVPVGKAVLTNVPDDEELTVSFGIQNGEAVIKVMTLDYVFVAKER